MTEAAQAETKQAQGLAGIVVGESDICTVGKAGKGLTYRGYSVEDLASYACFEEAAYLLLYGQLPNKSELEEYKSRLAKMRGVPAPLKAVLEQLPAQSHPMDVCVLVVLLLVL